jgi:hypothetical protein
LALAHSTDAQDLDPPQLWAWLLDALQADGHPAAEQALAAGQAWLARALPQVPEPFRASFLERNAAVARLRRGLSERKPVRA